VLVFGKFIKNTTASGLFAVFECNDGSHDEFIAIQLEEENAVEQRIRNTPSSTYTVLVYDLEENGLPSTTLAYRPPNDVIVSRGGSVPSPVSNMLRNADISFSGSKVTITCEAYSGASCILVYREFGSESLAVMEIPTTTATTTFTMEGLEKYTFAVFGKSGDNIDERPLVAKKHSEQRQPPTITQQIPPDKPSDNTRFPVAAILGAVVGLCVFIAHC
jgi:hypothetical protein